MTNLKLLVLCAVFGLSLGCAQSSKSTAEAGATTNGDTTMQTPAHNAPAQDATSAGRSLQLRQMDDGSTVQAQMGDTIVVELDANPSTGFTWEAPTAAEDGVLKLKSSDFLSPAELNAGQRVVGQGGTMRIVYQVAATGKATMELVYRRPWEKDVPPAKTYRVTIESH